MTEIASDSLPAEAAEFAKDVSEVEGILYFPLPKLAAWYERINAIEAEAQARVVAGLVVIAARLERLSPHNSEFAIAQIISLLGALLGDESQARDMLDQAGVDSAKAMAAIGDGQPRIKFEKKDGTAAAGAGLLGLLGKK